MQSTVYIATVGPGVCYDLRLRLQQTPTVKTTIKYMLASVRVCHRHRALAMGQSSFKVAKGTKWVQSHVALMKPCCVTFLRILLGSLAFSGTYAFPQSFWTQMTQVLEI